MSCVYVGPFKKVTYAQTYAQSAQNKGRPAIVTVAEADEKLLFYVRLSELLKTD